MNAARAQDLRGASPAPLSRAGRTAAHTRLGDPLSELAESSSASARRRSSSRHTDASKPRLTSRPITLWIHEPPNFSSHEIVLSPELLRSFGSIGENDLLEVILPAGSTPRDSNEPGHPFHGIHKDDLRAKRKLRKTLASRSFVFKPNQGAPESEASTRTNQLQLSLSRNIANVYGFSNRTEVILSKVARADNVISHVELYFRDQYVGRADMWRITALLEDSCVYVGQKINLAGSVRATIGRIFIKERKVTSGYVAADTKAIFRSESAKYHLFFQLGKEMWDFDEDGEIYYEKALTGFIPELLKRWRSVPTNHVISIILFARVWYDESELPMLEETAIPVRQEEGEGGRHYIDYYKVLVDLESSSNWSDVMSMLKEEFFRFQHDILLIGRPVAGPAGAPWKEEQHADLLRRDRALLAGRVSASHEGNILEAINLALNPFDEHYIDRDLNRTGLDLVIVTAGTGHFRVDKKWLRMTTERMIDNGIGLDLVCLTKMPLHSVPLFRFTSQISEATLDIRRDARRSQTASSGQYGATPASAKKFSPATPSDPLYTDSVTSTARGVPRPTMEFYSIPHWIDASFYNLQQDKPFRADRFVPRVKMQEIQQIGYMENEISDISLPYLDLRRIAGNQMGGTAGFGAFSGPKSMSLGSSGTAPGWQSGGSTGLKAFASREQRRAIRERFDRETFRDLEFAPAKVRAESLLASGAKLSGVPIGTPRREHFDGSDVQMAESATTEKYNTPSKASRRIGRRPNLESHAEDDSGVDSFPEQSNVDSLHTRDHSGYRNFGESPTASPAISRATSFANLPTNLSGTFSPFASSSRPGSVRSVAMSTRSLRPLQPIGKAEALVAPSQHGDFLDELPDDAQGDLRVSSPSIPAQDAATYALSDRASETSSTRPKGAAWLWRSLTGGRSRHGSPTPERPVTAPSTTSSPSQPTSAASLRIRALLQSSPNQRTSSFSRHRDAAVGNGTAPQPGPITIPAPGIDVQQSPQLKSAASTRTQATVRVSKEQEAYDQGLEEAEALARLAQGVQVEKQTLVNPANPRKSLMMHSTGAASGQLLRWQHLFPRRMNRHVVKWRSITTPACLPLTTFYLPTEQELLEQWSEYPHTLSVSSDFASFLVKRSPSEAPAVAVLRELTIQRLAQGFQFIVPMNSGSQDGWSAAGRASSSKRYAANPSRGNFVLRPPSELFQPGTLSSGNPILLGMSNQIHRLSYDRAAGAINIERYIRKMPFDTAPLEYSCCIWPRHLPGYQTVYANFKYPDFGSYDWTYLDSLVAGHADEDKFSERLKYWRTRFVIVPSEGRPPPMLASTGEPLDDEEVRLIGMDRLADLFSRARWRGRSGTAAAQKANDGRTQAPALLRFIPTSLDPSMSMWDRKFMQQMENAIVEDAQAQRDASRVKRATIKESSLDAIASAMGMEKHGLKIEDRLWNRRIYEASFTGVHLTTWLVCEYADVRNRDEAVEWGHELMKRGLFEHVHAHHGFLDGHYFYRLKGPYAKKAAEGKRKTTESTGTEGSNRKASVPQTTDNSNSQNGHGATRRRRMKMSRSIIIDVDPSSKSDRAETAFLHYDISHNPSNGFNAQLHWLGTTARFIDDAVQNWTRLVERHGLRLIEAPIGQICDVAQHNPFQAPLRIHLSLSPPPTKSYAHLLPEHTNPEDYFEWALLRKFGFALDQEAAHRYPSDVEIIYESRPSRFDYSQFVHRSGVAFVQVLREGQGFLWLNNRLFNSHLGGAAGDGNGGSGAAARGKQSSLAAEGASGGRHRNPGGGNARGGRREATSEHHPSEIPDPDRTRREFEQFCSDPVALYRFYQEVSDGMQGEAKGTTVAACAQ